MTREGRWALVAYGLGWLLVPGGIAVVIHGRVPDPAELLRDVAGNRGWWIGANALLVVLQALLAWAAPALGRLVGGVAGDAVRWLLAVSAGAFVSSGVAHGVLGAHLAAGVDDGPVDAELVRLVELVHALGDTWWFVGLGAVAAATTVASSAWWPRRAVPRRLAVLGAAAVAVGLLQYGWFVDHAMGVFAVPGAVLQAAWFVAVGLAAPRPGVPWESSTARRVRSR